MSDRAAYGLQEISVQFKRFVFHLTILFVIYRLAVGWLAPTTWHLPDTLVLSIMVLLLGYLWAGEGRTRAQLAEAQQRLHEAEMGTLAALVQAVEAKDPYTRGHSEQVRRLAVALAGRLGMDARRVGVVSRAAVLHDIGKLETPDAILHKSAPLSADDWETMKKHPTRTATILESLEFLAEELRIATLHHERYDGSGYAVGLRGDAIPVEAAIIAVADAFDAMNSDRPYRKRLSRERILQELQKGRGLHYPPALVDAFVTLLSERPELWMRVDAT